MANKAQDDNSWRFVLRGKGIRNKIEREKTRRSIRRATHRTWHANRTKLSQDSTAMVNCTATVRFNVRIFLSRLLISVTFLSHSIRRYGPPPSYPNLKIPGLNAPIPDGTSFGYHAGGWGKPPVDEKGKPLYGDVFGTNLMDPDVSIPLFSLPVLYFLMKFSYYFVERSG